MESGNWSTRSMMCLVSSVTLALALLLVATVATPSPPKKPADGKVRTPKPPSFPLNLFAEAGENGYVSDQVCASCHRTSVDSFQRSPHAAFMNDPKSPADRRGCQACHGPGPRHLEHRTEETGLYQNVISYSHAKPAEVAAACLRCHGDTITERHWQQTRHSRAGISCTDCHQIHWADRLGRERIRTIVPGPKSDRPTDTTGAVFTRPVGASVDDEAADPKSLLKTNERSLCGSCHRAQLAEFRHNFHHPVPEGRMVCSDCHDVHSNHDDRKRVRTAKQSCITCHAEVAGPFVYEHDPVSDLTGEGCLECHRPHGSSNPSMLNAFSRGLCTQCHTDKAINHNPGQTCWNSGCHSAVHGSNHDPYLLRR